MVNKDIYWLKCFGRQRYNRDSK